jgi:hypothetical protein
MTVNMKITAFWDARSCSLVEVDLTPLKRRATSTRLHGPASQKAVTFSPYIIQVIRKFIVAFTEEIMEG